MTWESTLDICLCTVRVRSCICALFPSCFLLFLRPCSGVFLLFVLLRPYSSHRLHVSKYVRTCCVICILPYLKRVPLCFICAAFVGVSCLFVVGVFVVLSYPVRYLAFDLPALINSPLFCLVFLSHCCL